MVPSFETVRCIAKTHLNMEYQEDSDQNKFIEKVLDRLEGRNDLSGLMTIVLQHKTARYSWENK